MMVVIGVACVALAVLALGALQHRPGKPALVWTNTEGKTTAVALSLILLLLGGVSFIVKGLLSQ
jgi:hypothetical protein